MKIKKNDENRQKFIVTYQTIFSDKTFKEEFDCQILSEWYYEDIKKEKLIRNVKLK